MTLLWLSCRCRDLRDADRRTESLRLPYRLSARRASEGPEPRRPRVVIPFKQASSRTSWPKRGIVHIRRHTPKLSRHAFEGAGLGHSKSPRCAASTVMGRERPGTSAVRQTKVIGALGGREGTSVGTRRTMIPGRLYRGCEWGTVAHHSKGR